MKTTIRSIVQIARQVENYFRKEIEIIQQNPNDLRISM